MNARTLNKTITLAAAIVAQADEDTLPTTVELAQAVLEFARRETQLRQLATDAARLVDELGELLQTPDDDATIDRCSEWQHAKGRLPAPATEVRS